MKELENKVIYQIYPKSFMDSTGSGLGDINGIRSKLDYIQQLGVDYIWLSPCCKSPQKDNGYDISDYSHIDPMFGSDEEYEALIKEANEKGMKVMMDLVLNHTSDQHEWFKKAIEGDKRYYDYYIWRDKPNEIESIFGGPAWTYHEKVGKYYFHLFDKSQPDLNWSNPLVRQDLYNMINMWIDKGVEGFRLDVIDLIGKDVDKLITSKGEKFYEYLQELNEQTFTNRLLTVGECWGSTLKQTYRMCNDKGLTQAFHFQHLALTSDGDKWHQYPLELQRLCDCLNMWQNEYNGIEAMVMHNHDQPRLNTLWLNDGEYRVQSSKLLITLFGLMHGNLYIYQGEEIGMTNAHRMNIDEYNDVETFNAYHRLLKEGYSEEETMKKIALISRDNVRTPMQWDDSIHAGFTTGIPWLKENSNYKEVNVKKDLESDESIYRYYQAIIQYRKKHYDVLKQPVTYTCLKGVIKMERGNLCLLANFTDQIQPAVIEGEILFTNYKDHIDGLQPYEVVVLQK